MRHFIAAVFCLFFCTSIFAQESKAPIPNLDSPHNTIYIHFYYLQPESYDPVKSAVTISRSETDSLKRIKAAIQIKQILDGKGLHVHMNLLPHEKDYLDTVSQKHFFTPFPKELPEVYLEKVNGKWYYSEETINMLPRLHKKVFRFGTDKLLNLFPKTKYSRAFGLDLWQYIAIAILIITVWMGRMILNRLFLPVVRILSRSRLQPELIKPAQMKKAAKALSLLFLVWVVRIFAPVLQLPIAAAEWTIMALNIFFTVAAVILMLRILDIVMTYAMSYAEKTESKLDEQLMPIFDRVLQIAIVLVGIIKILALLEVNVTALIAGLSLGGLALALAAQDTVKNLIGSAMIFFDRPFQIGDFVSGADFEGTVVEVGVRSTRIQKVDFTIISVPNGAISNVTVANLGMRKYRLMLINIGITYDTPPMLIEKFLEGLKLIVQNHPTTVKENYFVHFNNLEASSLNILFRVALEVKNLADELVAKEEILLGIMRLAEALGINFAFPSSTLFVEEFPEKKSNKAPYNTDFEEMNSKIEGFIEDFKKRISVG